MSNILSYPLIHVVSGEDLLIISDISEEGNPTRSVRVDQLVGSGGLPYVTYLAILSQSGTAIPVVDVLENSAGITINWVYGSAGRYAATYSVPLVNIKKVAVTCSQTTKSSDGGIVVNVTASSVVGFNVTSVDLGGSNVNSQLLGAVLEIKIYP